MNRNLEDIASEALGMNVEARAALAKRLLDSLDELTPEEIERLWVEEAARRYKQLKAGTASSSPSDEVFARLEARNRRRSRGFMTQLTRSLRKQSLTTTEKLPAWATDS
jgi:hypothetical protein